jgi:CRISPR/Cas system CMR-associated protein Cmr1 (group 7 of RAMP superfamily)
VRKRQVAASLNGVLRMWFRRQGLAIFRMYVESLLPRTSLQ